MLAPRLSIRIRPRRGERVIGERVPGERETNVRSALFEIVAHEEAGQPHLPEQIESTQVAVMDGQISRAVFSVRFDQILDTGERSPRTIIREGELARFCVENECQLRERIDIPVDYATDIAERPNAGVTWDAPEGGVQLTIDAANNSASVNVLERQEGREPQNRSIGIIDFGELLDRATIEVSRGDGGLNQTSVARFSLREVLDGELNNRLNQIVQREPPRVFEIARELTETPWAELEFNEGIEALRQEHARIQTERFQREFRQNTQLSVKLFGKPSRLMIVGTGVVVTASVFLAIVVKVLSDRRDELSGDVDSLKKAYAAVFKNVLILTLPGNGTIDAVIALSHEIKKHKVLIFCINNSEQPVDADVLIEYYWTKDSNTRIKPIEDIVFESRYPLNFYELKIEGGVGKTANYPLFQNPFYRNKLDKPLDPSKSERYRFGKSIDLTDGDYNPGALRIVLFNQSENTSSVSIMAIATPIGG